LKGVTVVQTLVVAEQRQAALPAELAGSLVLAAADALVSLSLRIGPHELVLLEEGTVRVCGGTPADELSSEQSLREVLDQLLLCSSSVTPSLLRASRRPSRGNVAEFVRELEVALIPTNRGAARRALARLCREVASALQQSPELQQVAESRAHAQARAESVQVPVVAPPPVLIEPEPVEEFEIVELEMSPSLPVLSVAPAARVAASVLPRERPQSPAPSTASFEIPDLEVPGATKAEFSQPAERQSIEHTVRLEVPSRPALNYYNASGAPFGFHAPIGSSHAAAVQLEYVELTDADVREATVQLPVRPSLRHRAPPKPPTRACPAPVTDASSIETRPHAIGTPSGSDDETAEPFLLVLPSLATEFIEDEPSEMLESPPPALDVIDSDDCDFASDGFAVAAASLNADGVDASESQEPRVPELEHTVLDVATFVEDDEYSMPEPPLPIKETESALFDEEVSPIHFRPQPILEPIAFLVEPEWQEVEESSDSSVSISDASDSKEPLAEAKVWEPHRYSAETRPPARVCDLEARIAQFAVREQDNSRELTRGLRSLAGINEDRGSEFSVTPPPMTYAPELSDPQTSESKNPIVRTLIGLGAVGAFFMLTSLTVGPRGHSALAATNPGLHAPNPNACLAAISVVEVPAGAAVRVTQAGTTLSRELIQVGRAPLRFDGLACDTPAELLVKLANRGWYRIPVESARLTPGGNPEPIRVKLN
jgi:hypothetical protein